MRKLFTLGLLALSSGFLANTAYAGNVDECEILKDGSLRISLHVGECTMSDGRPSSSVVEAARRAAGYAPQGKIIVTQTLRDILPGSGVVFDLHQSRSTNPGRKPPCCTRWHKSPPTRGSP